MSIFKNRYIYVKPEEKDHHGGAGSILQLEYPYFTGRILKFSTDDEYASFMTAQRMYPVARIPGYKMAIQFCGALEDLPEDFDQMKAQKIMDEMGKYFYSSKVEVKPKGYERFLLNNN